jgi:hypothetical protein
LVSFKTHLYYIKYHFMQMQTSEDTEFKGCGPQTSDNSEHRAERSESSGEDINAELLTALKTINKDSTGTIDRVGLRDILGVQRPALDEPDLADLLFLALEIDLGERCCLRRLIRALQPHLSNTIPSELSRESFRTAVQSFLHADFRSKHWVRSTAVYALAPFPKTGADPMDLEAQLAAAEPTTSAGRRCAALVCCALAVAAAVTFGICLAVAKLGPGGSS